MLQPFHIITDDFIADELRAVDGAYARPNSPWWHSAWLALRREKRQLFHIWHFLMQSNNSRGPAHTPGVTTPSKRRSLRHAAGGQKSRAHHFTRNNARAAGQRCFTATERFQPNTVICKTHQCITSAQLTWTDAELADRRYLSAMTAWCDNIYCAETEIQLEIFTYQREKITLHYYPKLWGVMKYIFDIVFFFYLNIPNYILKDI